MVELYLDHPMGSERKRIEVPLVIWKLVIDQKTNDSVAFFTSNDNDMNEKQVAQFQTLCPSVCDELGYNFKEEPKSGITLCCKYEDFEKHIKFLPIHLSHSNLLKNTVRLEKLNSKGPKSPSKKKSVEWWWWRSQFQTRISLDSEFWLILTQLLLKKLQSLILLIFSRKYRNKTEKLQNLK